MEGVFSWFINLVFSLNFCVYFFKVFRFFHSFKQVWTMAIDISLLIEVPCTSVIRYCLGSFNTTLFCFCSFYFLIVTSFPCDICYPQGRCLFPMVQFYLFFKPSSNVTFCTKPLKSLADPFSSGKINHSFFHPQLLPWTIAYILIVYMHICVHIK